MAAKRSKPTAKPRRTEIDPIKLRVINIRDIDPETYRFLAEGRGSQGLRSWLPYFVRLEKLRRAAVEDAQHGHGKARLYFAAAGLLFPGAG